MKLFVSILALFSVSLYVNSTTAQTAPSLNQPISTIDLSIYNIGRGSLIRRYYSGGNQYLTHDTFFTPGTDWRIENKGSYVLIKAGGVDLKSNLCIEFPDKVDGSLLQIPLQKTCDASSVKQQITPKLHANGAFTLENENYCLYPNVEDTDDRNEYLTIFRCDREIDESYYNLYWLFLPSPNSLGEIYLATEGKQFPPYTHD